MTRRRPQCRAARSAGLLLALSAVLFLDGCSQAWSPGIRRVEGGDLEVRAPRCWSGTDSGQRAIEVQRWNEQQSSFDVVWRTDSPRVTAAGDLVIDASAAGLDPGAEYVVEVVGSPSRDGSFIPDALPGDGSYDLDGEVFPATAAGRAELDEAACDDGGLNGRGIAILLGGLAVVGLVALGILIGGTVLFARWLDRRSVPPEPAPWDPSRPEGRPW